MRNELTFSLESLTAMTGQLTVSALDGATITSTISNTTTTSTTSGGSGSSSGSGSTDGLEGGQNLVLGFVLVRIVYTPLEHVHVIGFLVGLGILMWGVGAMSLAVYNRLQPKVAMVGAVQPA